MKEIFLYELLNLRISGHSVWTFVGSSSSIKFNATGHWNTKLSFFRHRLLTDYRVKKEEVEGAGITVCGLRQSRQEPLTSLLTDITLGCSHRLLRGTALEGDEKCHRLCKEWKRSARQRCASSQSWCEVDVNVGSLTRKMPKHIHNIIQLVLMQAGANTCSHSEFLLFKIWGGVVGILWVQIPSGPGYEGSTYA